MVSVAMATFNGEKYIQRQLGSVLANLSDEDEIIISDDGSNDGTLNMIRSFHDDRIKVFEGPKDGLVKNFANAIDKCQGDYIFLCDQDDDWYPNKVERVLEAFEKIDCVLIEHNCRVCDEKGDILYPSFFRHRRVRVGFIKNIIRNTYHGCLIAFRSELKNKLELYPDKGCLHDQWIGLVAEKNGGCYFLDEVLMDYYRHPGNASSFVRLPLRKQLADRQYLIRHIMKSGIMNHRESSKQ